VGTGVKHFGLGVVEGYHDAVGVIIPYEGAKVVRMVVKGAGTGCGTVTLYHDLDGNENGEAIVSCHLDKPTAPDETNTCDTGPFEYNLNSFDSLSIRIEAESSCGFTGLSGCILLEDKE
jgi:hypothetical protein